jgi:hypothetical protein
MDDDDDDDDHDHDDDHDDDDYDDDSVVRIRSFCTHVQYILLELKLLELKLHCRYFVDGIVL